MWLSGKGSAGLQLEPLRVQGVDRIVNSLSRLSDEREKGDGGRGVINSQLTMWVMYQNVIRKTEGAEGSVRGGEWGVGSEKRNRQTNGQTGRKTPVAYLKAERLHSLPSTKLL